MPRRYTAQGTLTTALTTEMDALANATYSALSAEISNDAASERMPYMNVELTLAATTTRTAGAFVGLYLVPKVDDSTYPTTYTAANDVMNNYYIGSFALDAATTATVVTIRGIDLPPCDFKLAVYNGTGVALAATTNLLKYRTYSDEYTVS